MSWLRRGAGDPAAVSGRPAVGGGPSAVLRVDWPACQGRGVCAEVLPELVTLDEWGYPIIRGEVDEDLLDLARQAAQDCPHRALRLVR